MRIAATLEVVELSGADCGIASCGTHSAVRVLSRPDPFPSDMRDMISAAGDDPGDRIFSNCQKCQ